MEVQDISKVMNAYISNQEMLGGALIVRKNDEIIYQNKWGFQNLEHSRSIEYDTMYRLMSMSKCDGCSRYETDRRRKNQT